MSEHVWVVEVLPHGSSRWRPVERDHLGRLLAHPSRKLANEARAAWAASVLSETASYRVAEYVRASRHR